MITKPKFLRKLDQFDQAARQHALTTLQLLIPTLLRTLFKMSSNAQAHSLVEVAQTTLITRSVLNVFIFLREYAEIIRAASNVPRLYAFYDNLIARLFSPRVFQSEDGRIPKRSTSGLRPLPPPLFLSRLPRLHLVVSEGVYKIRDLLTMFTPTRACAAPSHMCIWSPINALYPSEETPFGDDDLRPPRSSGDILFPGIFTSRYITHRLDLDGVGVMLGAQIEGRWSARLIRVRNIVQVISKCTFTLNTYF